MEITDDKPDDNSVLISVIMGVYNQWNREELYRAVQSILDQTMEEFEFIIWDDGSDPRAAAYIQELKNLDRRIVLAGKIENRGLAHSLNECIRLASGRYIARMDADDTSLPKRLQYQYEFLETHPEFSWCGCNAYLADENGIWGARIMPEQPAKKDYLKYSPYIHPTVMFRRELFEQEKGYQETQETLRCEDYEIFMRFKEKGYSGYNLQKRLFIYTEDRHAFQRRTWKARMNEVRIRYRHFRALGLLPKGSLYVIRPLIGGVVPNQLIQHIKFRQCCRNLDAEKKISANEELECVEKIAQKRSAMV